MWNIREQNAHPGEDLEQARQRKEEEADAREPLQGHKADFTKQRVTGLICNKMISMPNAVSQDEEVRINAENLEILDTWDLFFSDHCDGKGSIRH